MQGRSSSNQIEELISSVPQLLRQPKTPLRRCGERREGTVSVAAAAVVAAAAAGIVGLWRPASF